jgi:DNA polymerase-3 subunit alpha
LKAHYPVEFYTTSFQYIKDDKKGKEVIGRVIAEIHKIGTVKVQPPDINYSKGVITSDAKKKTIYWSLKKIKFVGEGAVKVIAEDRQANGKYFSFQEFNERMKGKRINKKAQFNMVLAGCFDEVEGVKEPADRIRIVRQFKEIVGVELPPIFSTSITRQDYFWSKMARELTGFGYIDYKKIIKGGSLSNLMKNYIDEDSFYDQDTDGKTVLICGLFHDLKERKSKKGVFCQLELLLNFNSVICTIWNDKYMEFQDQLKDGKGKAIVISGYVKFDSWKKKNVLMSNDYTKIEVI